MKNYIEKWEDLSLTNDYIFCKVFEDAELCKEMLEILLDVKIHHLEYPTEQKHMKSSHRAKGIRIDVFVQDSTRVFDVEIQNASEDGLALRTRYYHSTMDTSLLKKGKNYTDLKESYVIFLCKFDPMKKGKPVYKFSMRDEENPEIILGDKTHTILYNIREYAKLKNSERKNFFSYLMRGKPCSPFTEKTEKRFQEVKNDEDWRMDYMTLEMKFKQREREAMQRGVAVGIAEERTDIARNLLNMNMPLETIAQATGLSLEEIEALKEE